MFIRITGLEIPNYKSDFMCIAGEVIIPKDAPNKVAPTVRVPMLKAGNERRYRLGDILKINMEMATQEERVAVEWYEKESTPYARGETVDSPMEPPPPSPVFGA